MEDKQTTEVREQHIQNGNETVTRQSVSQQDSISGAVLAKRVVYYIGGALMALLALRFALFLLGASRASGFVDFIYALSGIFVAPFNGIFAEPTYGQARFDSATLVAIVVYALLTVGIAKLFTLGKRDPDAV